MSKLVAMATATAASFAHLLGRPGAKAEEGREEGDDEKEKKVATDSSGDDDAGEKKEPSGAKAEDGDGKDKDGEDGDEKEAKKAKSKKTDDDQGGDGDEDGDADDAEMRGSSPAASARARERARCSAIFSTAAAAARPDFAAHVAFETTLTRSEAIRSLETAAAGTNASSRKLNSRERLDERMDRVDARNPGGSSAAGASMGGDQVVAHAKALYDAHRR